MIFIVTDTFETLPMSVTQPTAASGSDIAGSASVSPHRSATRSALLDGPIARQMLGLAWPVLVVLALQTFANVAETYFVSFLGTDALAGVALVFPVFMLMAMMSNGGIGGGVASAESRNPVAGNPGAVGGSAAISESEALDMELPARDSGRA